MAIALALICLLFAGFNDVVFKLFARKPRPMGLYVTLIGIIWAVFFMAVAGRSMADRLTLSAVTWGGLSGVCSVIANLLLINAMKRHEGSVCATIYRLNLVPAALLAFWLFKEPITAGKLIGIVCAVAAVLLFSRSGVIAGRSMKSTALLAMIFAALLRAAMGLFYKHGLANGADELVVLSINGCLWILGGLVYHVAEGRRAHRAEVYRGVLHYGALSGFLICGIVGFMMLALKHGEASVVLPIAQLSFVATALIAAFVLHEKLNVYKIAALALATGSVLCML